MMLKKNNKNNLIISIVVVVTLSYLTTGIFAPTGQSYCRRVIEAASHSMWCDRSDCLVTNGNMYALCNNRGTCVDADGASTSTDATSCTDCSWTNQGISGASLCNAQGGFTNTPFDMASQQTQLQRQLNLPFIMIRTNPFYPETMRYFDDAVDELITRPSASTEIYRQPKIFLFLDEARNNTYNKLRFGVVSPPLGFTTDPTLTGSLLDKTYTPLYNYYITPLTNALPNVDYNTYYEFADMNVGDINTMFEVVIRKSESQAYVVNDDTAWRTSLYNRESVPNPKTGGVPYKSVFQPFIKQGAFFRRFRSNNMTKRVASLAASISDERNGAGQTFEMSVNFNSFTRNVSNFSLPSIPGNANLYSVSMIELGSPTTPESKFLLPGFIRMKMTAISNNWWIPMYSWRIQTWVCGESPLLIYQGLEANPPGSGSTSLLQTRRANALVPIAPLDMVNQTRYSQQDLDDIFAWEAKPIDVKTVGNMATIFYLSNGSINIIYHRAANTHQFVASDALRNRFEEIFLVNGTSNASNINVKFASRGSAFVMWQPYTKSYYVFGYNLHGRFAYPNPFSVNTTLSGEQVNATFLGIHGNDTILDMSLGEEFMVVVTSGNKMYYAGNSLYGESYYAACVKPSPAGFNQAQTNLVWVQDVTEVAEVHTGSYFTIFVRTRDPWVGGCGQEFYITPFYPLTPSPTLFDRFSALADRQKPRKVCTGLFHACIHANNKQVSCWGVLRTNKAQRACSGSTYNFQRDLGPFQSGEDMSCGDSHVVVQRFVGVNNGDGSTLQSYMVCGSADKGQLGAAYQLVSDSANPNLRPLFTAPDKMINAQTADTSAGANLAFPPTYEIYKMIGVRDATYGFTQPRRHINVENMWSNWITNIGRPPPTGWHVMSPTFGAEGPFHIDFDTYPGVQLLCISNQSKGTTWITPSDSATELGYEWLPNATAATLKPDLGAGAAPYYARHNSGGTPGFAYFINWHKFTYNTSKYDGITSNPFIVNAELRMNIPHFIVTMSTGELFRLGVDAFPCNINEPIEQWGRSLLWCDAKNNKRIIWRSSGAAVPPGYSDALPVTDWIALNVKFRAVALLRVLGVVNNIFLNNSNFVMSQNPVRHFYSQYNITRWHSPPCSTMANPLDCGGAVFYEPYSRRPQTQIVTATTLASFPINGVRLDLYDVEPNMGKYFVQMKPVGSDIQSALEISGSESGIRGSSQKFIGFLNVCIFVKIGVRYYYLLLLPNGQYFECSRSPTTATGAVIPPPGTIPYAPEGGQVNKVWQLAYDNSAASNVIPGYIRIRNIDLAFAANYDANYDINDVYFKLGCSGGVMASPKITDINATSWQKWTNSSAFMLWTNDSIDDLFAMNPMWWEKDTLTTPSNASILLQERLYSPLGCDGGLVIPVQPMKEITSFHTFVQVLNPMKADEEIVIALMSPHFSDLHVKYQFVVGKDGPRIETISDTTTWNKVFNKAGRGVVSACNNPEGHPIKAFPRNHWNSFSLVHDLATAKTEVWWNGELACKASNWLGLAVNQPIVVSGVYMGIRSLYSNFEATARFREIVMCDSRTIGFKRYGCGANGISYRETSVSVSPSVSESFTQHLTNSLSIMPSESETHSYSISETDTRTLHPTESDSLSMSLTESLSVSETRSIEESASNTSSFSMSETFSSIHIHNLHLLEFNQNLVDSNLIRRTGLLLSFYLQGDLWNPYADWANKPAGYLLFKSDLNEYENPNALGYSYIIEGVITATIRHDNWSILDLQIGPSGSYNSGRDETLVFRPRELGCASKILPPNNITIKIPGAGFFVSGSDRAVEVLAMGSVVISVFALGPGSMVVRFASNLIITNFQCYNNEYFPQTWMFNPLRLRISDSYNLGLAVGNFIMICAIFAVFGISMFIFGTVQKKGWHKVYGYFGWPSLPILLSLLFVPGLMFGSWRTAFEADSAKFYFVPLATVILVFVPLIYLYSKIMDDANFNARFEYRDADVLAVRAKKYPIFSQFQLPGQWIATDKYGEFVNTHGYLFLECTEKRKYWVLYEICVLMMESFICSITNTKYSFCGIQMMVVFLMRFALFVAALRLRPRSAKGMHWVIIVLYGGQALMALLFGIYAFQKLTNTLRSFVGYMMVGSSFTFAVLALLCTTGAAHERFLEAVFYRVLKRESDLTQRADPYIERKVEDVIEVSEEDGDDDSREKSSAEEELLSPHHHHRRQQQDSIQNNFNDSELKDISMIQKDHDQQYSVPNSKTSVMSEGQLVAQENPLFTSEQEEEMRRKAEEEAKQARRREKRNIWNLLAMEEATDAPSKNIAEYDEL